MKRIAFIIVISLIGIAAVTIGSVSIVRGKNTIPLMTKEALVDPGDIPVEEQVVEAPTEAEAVGTNSDNISGPNIDPRYLVKGLAENTYIPSEAFGIKALTDQEKADLISIASQHPYVSNLMESGSEYMTGLQWIGLSPTGGHGLLPYDTFEKGVPTVLNWPQKATFYPAVNFHFGSFVITLAVDPDKREVVYTTNSPTFKGPSAK